jgi:hypothetical protein
MLGMFAAAKPTCRFSPMQITKMTFIVAHACGLSSESLLDEGKRGFEQTDTPENHDHACAILTVFMRTIKEWGNSNGNP